jgi:hypothetical protein
MRGAMPPLPQYTFMAWCLVKHRDVRYPLFPEPIDIQDEISYLVVYVTKIINSIRKLLTR